MTVFRDAKSVIPSDTLPRCRRQARYGAMDTKDPRIERWLSRDPDPQTRAELQSLIAAEDTEELQRRFGARLAFGTAGLRGVVGAGPGLMNRLVIRESTAGLGTYLLDNIEDCAERGVVIGFDGRRGSRIFAEDAAATLAGLGIKAWLGDRELPTPVCAFAVTHLGCAAGIVVTASHNPPEYNGYKVYWQHGAQIIPPHDAGIATAIDRAARESLPWLSPSQARSEGLIRSIDDAVIEQYLTSVRELSVHRDAHNRQSMTFAYTPMHGVGAEITEIALKRAGFTQVHTVPEQREPDGAFPTVAFPNPEEPGAMDLVIALAKKHEAIAACAHDPDADRLAVALRTSDGDYQMLTGDQLGALLGSDQMASHQGSVTVATTLVSSGMLRVLAQAYGAEYFETLTGFKWIANGAMEREAKSQTRFVFGYEEALGYTIGSLVRDKDGISALLAFCEMAACLAAEGRTVLDELERLYREHGLFLTTQRSLALDPHGPKPGDALRAKPPQSIAGRSISRRVDLLAGEAITEDGKHHPVKLPPSDVLVYELGGDARIIIRPSGTEPKVKCYYEIRREMGEDEAFGAAEASTREHLDALVATHQAELAAMLPGS